MANEEHLEILKQGLKVWNRWQKENTQVQLDPSRMYVRKADLTGADLAKADLLGANLQRVDFRKANLREADLSKADLSEATLREADLSGAILQESILFGADLGKANLVGAFLKGADLLGANLQGADLSRAYLSWTDLTMAALERVNLNRASMQYVRFVDVDLSEVKGLDSVSHQGPSFIDIHTIYGSRGRIPEAFLRGCGVADNFITYVASLTGEAIQYYSCFISYSSQDEAFAQRLHNDLQGQGVRCWFAPEDMKIGDKIRFRVDESIRIYDKLLLILSKSSIASEWVEHEVEHALDLEREREGTVLFPVRLDQAVMGAKVGWAGSIRRTRHIGDFCEWKEHDAYRGAFDRLLRDLKAEDE
jgi:hypothetical protein